MNKAGFFSRFVAWFIDGFMVSIVAGLIVLILNLLLGLSTKTNGNVMNFLIGTVMAIIIISLFFVQFLYFGYLWSKNGQSIGMRLLNIKVVRRDGQPLSFLRAGLRGTVGYWISSLIMGLGYLWAAFDGQKEAWHDKVFDTWVVIR